MYSSQRRFSGADLHPPSQVWAQSFVELIYRTRALQSRPQTKGANPTPPFCRPRKLINDTIAIQPPLKISSVRSLLMNA